MSIEEVHVLEVNVVYFGPIILSGKHKNIGVFTLVLDVVVSLKTSESKLSAFT